MGKRAADAVSSSDMKDLFSKKGSTRVDLLESIIRILTNSYQIKFAETNFATLLYGCLNCFKKGSLKESCLACHALELLAITIGCGENAQELYRESLSTFSEALKQRSEPTKLVSILDCLAIVTFICGDSLDNNSLETERAMEVIWDFIVTCEKSSNESANNTLTSVQASAISSWSLLLTASDNWMLKVNYWNRAMNTLLNMLDTDDVSIDLAVTEALGVMLEVGFLEKFVSITQDCDDSLDEEANNFENGFSSMEELKESIIDRVKIILSKPEVEKLPNKKAIESCLELLEEDCFPETPVKIGKSKLILNRWSELLQLNFVKRLLRTGFVSHMLGNEVLHGIFNFTIKGKTDVAYVAEREDVIIRRFLPEVKRPDYRIVDGKKLNKAPSSIRSKAATQLLNKHRSLKDAESSSFFEAMDD